MADLRRTSYGWRRSSESGARNDRVVRGNGNEQLSTRSPRFKCFPPCAEIGWDDAANDGGTAGKPRKGTLRMDRSDSPAVRVTAKDDVRKVLAVRRAFDAGAEWANSRRWSATAQRDLTPTRGRILRAVLDREPTADEIAAAMSDDDEESARS